MSDSKDRQQVAMVTGANGLIGTEICKGLTGTRDFEVVLACRDEQKAKRAQQDVIGETGNDDVRTVSVDTSRRESVYELADQWEGPLDVLINAAAATPRTRQETPEGLEVQFATNVMGYFWMMRAFRPILANSTPSRVVNVASYWAGGLKIDDLQFERRGYDNHAAYRQAKQANRMLSTAFADRFADDGICVYSCHPGDVPSKLARSLGFHGSDTPEQAAETPVWLATAEIGPGDNGGYFRDKARKACRFGRDREAVEALYQRCLEYDQ